MKKTLLGLCTVAALTLTACSSGPDSGAEADEPTEITVFAAASLTEVFEDIADEFKAADENAPDVKFSFAGSSDLVSQISEGAPADVVATADEKTMKTLKSDDLLAGDTEMFASNTLTLAVADGNPKAIKSSEDFTGNDLVVCAPQVPCGAATQKWAELNDVALDPVSEENSVTDVLGKVSAGQADAGIVYVTDIARADGEVEQVELDGADKVINKYPAATVKASENQKQADAFVKFLGSDTAQKLLRDAGFAAG
ncbi:MULTISPECIES: molybdate ABC transporter substrate-binding protein [Brevibacterium]|jgi:molybdate transport system substrate-binding protein|uniref:Molybdate-binding protein n=3 Tax=Brevibacterium TaxID=1696 RepID=A0A142NM30_BRELN|nr:molybdate ABC transporter substrate-binding protein [Brevibacterium linens]AMT93847.1 molybdate-binding protein [Brevibacterium linens]HHX46486.1 molybdate ABC transporter substrate-binding protein [Brevibacterium sp.]HJE77272.1 molybdate ABC transporter substrate-binding protein [Brevibacterium epidermidis]